MDILITYDIADTAGSGARRLRKLADVCGKYGERVQYSVFECRISATNLARLRVELEDIIDASGDSVRIYQFPGNIQKAIINLGREPDHSVGSPWIL